MHRKHAESRGVYDFEQLINKAAREIVYETLIPVYGEMHYYQRKRADDKHRYHIDESASYSLNDSGLFGFTDKRNKTRFCAHCFVSCHR